ncbi:MAG TPA: adenylosuccinate synthetase [Ktedonosporobacter sp.]|nr:adenylosuccinate synthetase [Ktedonosporobacter sp.]
MSQKKQAIFIADLGFGDAGKGTITDFLTRELSAHTIVRYNGGPQAAHNVVTPDGRHHTFSQFGSGMFLPGTKTLLSRFMLINPLNMLKEARHLSALGISDALARTQIDRRALVITPFQKALNRLREVARGADRHGSCGEGVGECMADHLAHGNVVLFAGDLRDRTTIAQKLRLLRDVKYAELEALCQYLPDTEQVRQERAIFTATGYLEDCIDVYRYFAGQVEVVDEAAIRAIFAQPGAMLLEGAQGVLLDENYGFAPYTTWSTTTFANADSLVQEHHYSGEVIKLGVLRTYATRHGAGPFPTEDPALTRTLPDQHNAWNAWQQTFRVGHLDLVATRYAIDVLGQLDCLVLTHLDRLEMLPEWKICTAYHYQGEEDDLSPYFEQVAGRLTTIKVRHPIDLAHQEQLTRKLWSCAPHYLELPPQWLSQVDLATYLPLLEEQLSAPIAILSYGPTATDKQCLRALRGCVLCESTT